MFTASEAPCHARALSPRAAAAISRPLTVNAGPEDVTAATSALQVAYQGVPGDYSEMAALKAYPECSPVSCNLFEDAFLAVERSLVDRAVLPIENSLGGSIHRNYDLLLRHRLHIVGEVQLPIHHCLMALPGASLASLTRVLSHPQGLAQCENTLTRLSSIAREAVDDTAGAAKMAAQEKQQGVRAVAILRALEIYGLQVLAEGIQDDADTITRFLMLAREPILPTNNRPFKTSIVFTLERGPGVLFKALSVFALRDINLTKIESRPQRDKPLLGAMRQRGSGHQEQPQPPNSAAPAANGAPAVSGNGGSELLLGLQLDGPPAEEGRQQLGMLAFSTTAAATYQMFDYVFYIDFQASLAERRAQNALRHLQEFSPFLRVLGSYPMDTMSANC